MSFNVFGEGEAAGFSLTDVLLAFVGGTNWRTLTGLGGLVALAYGGQLAAGELSGAGVSWGSTHWLAAPSGPHCTSCGPSFTLGSSVFYAHAGDIVHVDADVDVQSGALRVYLWRLPGMGDDHDSPVTTIAKSGEQAFDIPVKQDAYYELMYATERAYPGKSDIKGGMFEPGYLSLSYRVSWRRQS